MKMRLQTTTGKHLLATLLTAGLLMQPVIARAATTPLTISNTPLFITTASVMPNIVMTIDDSGSMAWGFVPDCIGGQATHCSDRSGTKRYTSSYFNAMYYNPSITYTPPPKYDNNGAAFGTAGSDWYPNASFTAAYNNGFNLSEGSPVNLSTGYQVTYSYDPDPTNLSPQTFTSGTNPFESTTSSTSTSTQNYSKVCNVTFNNNYSDDSIDSSGVSGSGCNSLFRNIGAGDLLTVSGAPTRNGSYTVKSVNGQSSVDVGSRWSSDSGPYSNVTLSWTHTTTTTTSTTIDPAYYYLFYTQITGQAKPASCDGTSNDDDCYIAIQVGSSADIFGGATATAAQKQQNFANWYSYYRTRTFAIRSGAMRALDGIDGSVRLAWQSLNTCDSLHKTSWSCAGTDGTARDNRIWRLNAMVGSGVSHKHDLYSWLAALPANNGTPLRTAEIRAGDYLTNSLDINSAFAQDPQITAGNFYSCRRNVHLMMTDGEWNSDSVSAYGNANNSSVTVPSGPGGVANYSWAPGHPYSDSNSNDLADIAFYYWATDLQTTLANNLSPIYKDLSGSVTNRWVNPKNDPATWQHMITYTVGLGLKNILVSPYPVWGGNTYAGDYPNLVAGTVAWPATAADSLGNVADLWHAALSSRGQFFAAESAQDIVNAFQSILTDVTAATSSSAALATNSTSINTGAYLFQATFDSADWSGHLLALPIQGDGTVGAQVWDSATLSPLSVPSTPSIAAGRNIVTSNGSAGQLFQWGSLSASQQTMLNTNAGGVNDGRGQDRLNWLRGDQSYENQYYNAGSNPNATFRSRTQTVLGDIVNSNPWFAQNNDFGYAGLPSSAPEQASYAAYLASKSTRLPYVYVGANDGMLHAFQADVGNTNSGKEVFAYVPSAVYANLSKLTDPSYVHQFYVDGPPTVGDAYIGGAWSSMLVGGLNGGGKSIYALQLYKDGTSESPASFGPSQVMWEYSDASDLGLTYSQPQIARLNNGQWAAIFGNGYNSTNGNAYLYVVNLQNGALIAKILAGSATSNGLSTPILYDANNDKIADYVYAGDLQGNMWKFDLSDANPANWKVANSGQPLFMARNSSGQVQPITAQPKVGSNPSGGVMVYFGTGQYLTSGDVSNMNVQSFYAIWDNGSAVTTTDRSQLQAQTIISQTSSGTTLATQSDNSTPTVALNTRVTSTNGVDYAGGKRGWYMDLVPPSGPVGERVVSTAILKYDRVIFTTLIPSASDPCVPGGDSWVMELTALTGAAPTTSVFDLNNDNSFDSYDQSSGGGVVAGVKSTQGILTTPVWLDKDTTGSIGFKEMSGSSGGIMSLKNKGSTTPPGGGAGGPPTRVFWQQIL